MENDDQVGQDAADADDGTGKRPYEAPKLTSLGLLRKLTRYTF